MLDVKIVMEVAEIRKEAIRLQRLSDLAHSLISQYGDTPELDEELKMHKEAFEIELSKLPRLNYDDWLATERFEGLDVDDLLKMRFAETGQDREMDWEEERAYMEAYERYVDTGLLV